MEATITGYKQGSVLFFNRGKKKIAFDLKDLEFKRILKSGDLKPMITGQAFFRKLTASDIAEGFRDEAYAKLINKVVDNEYRLTNFASLFNKVSQYIHLESYLLLGIDVDTHAFKNPASQFTKEVLEFMKESGIRFSNDGFERNFEADKKLFTDLCTYVRRRHYLDLEVYRMLYSILSDRYDYKKLQSLVIPLGERREVAGYYRYDNETVVGFGCEYKSLFDYLVRIDRTEAVDFDDALELYRDYLSMSRDMEKRKALLRLQETKPEATIDDIGFESFGRVEKYPAYIRTRHDIVAKNYRAYKDTYDEVAFRKNVDYGFEYAWGSYHVIAPKSSADIQNEGSTLHHCVASYVSRVLDGTTQILFMRKDPKESLITVEVRAGSIVQARGYNNRSIDAVEKRWLETFARNKNLNYGSVKRDDKMPTPPIVAIVKYDKDIAFLREVSQLVNG